METVDDDDDLKLFQASASLLSDLEHALPKVLWKRSKGTIRGAVHSSIKRPDLDYLITLVRPPGPATINGPPLLTTRNRLSHSRVILSYWTPG